MLIGNMELHGNSVTHAQESVARKARFPQVLGKGEISVKAIQVAKGARVLVNDSHDELPASLRRRRSPAVVIDPDTRLCLGWRDPGRSAKP